MKTATSIKTEKDLIAFLSLDFKRQRREWLQAYYSNLFDLWEVCPIEISPETEQALQEARWRVNDYANTRNLNLDRDSEWLVVMDENGEVHDPIGTGGTLFK